MTVAAAPAAGREFRAIGLVTSAHFLSHFYQLVLPPLFPIMAEVYGLSFLQLGVIMTVASVSTGLAQTPVGFLVDRIGARPEERRVGKEGVSTGKTGGAA